MGKVKAKVKVEPKKGTDAKSPTPIKPGGTGGSFPVDGLLKKKK